MNVWKPLAIVSTCAFIVTLGCQAASATPGAAHPETRGAEPNMEAALTRLREARAALERAEHNKGGWRVAALEATDTAIKETQRGIAYAETH